MKAFQAKIDKLEASDTQVLGVSIDTPFSNHAFAMQNGITFPLLSDMSVTAIREYGLERKANVAGVSMTTARRATFVIDKNGKVIEAQADAEAVDPTKIIDACTYTAPGK